MPDTMPGDPTDPTSMLRRDVEAALRAAWRPEGYTAPNTDVYPWLWLWDSCFHSIVWLALDDAARGLRELEMALSTIDETGFVPHMAYVGDPERAVELWGRRGSSSITQPPMYGHALAELARAGVDVPDRLLDQATRGLRFLFERRSRIDGLIEVVHPWETGCDDSPRWDGLCPGGFTVDRWRSHKMDLLTTIERGPRGEPLHNPACAVAPAGFNALIAWNALELASVTDDPFLAGQAAELGARLDDRFDPNSGTWVDAGVTEAGSGRVRTADALLALLTCQDLAARRTALADLVDERAYSSAYGPRGVHLEEPSYEGATYWRGPVWPQLAYLLWIAMERGDTEDATAAEVVRTSTVAGAIESGLAEYWNGDTGRGLGAIPQSWTGLALLLERAG
jgi:Mannosylglycerate hydrolase MGH1-like glycoside hydrolase domain